MSARVIGLGQRYGGDDAAGIAVIAHLRELGCPAGLELVEIHDASALVDALCTPLRVVVVDALLGRGRPGTVHLLSAASLGASALTALSTHGLDLPQAIALAEALHPEAVSRDIAIVGVEIARVERFHRGLSPEVEGAIEAAAQRVLAIAARP